jgi:transcription antitermination factor NusG
MMALQQLVDPQPVPAPLPQAPWFVVLTQPQQDITTVWRLHELGLEMFVPVIRRRVKTGRIGKNGHKVTRVIAKPMFPGYGFLRTAGVTDYSKVEDVRGVRKFMLDISGEPIRLPHAAILAVRDIQDAEHKEKFMAKAAKNNWKRGDKVRIDADGGAWAGLVGTVEWANSKGNIGLLLGMIRHTLPAEMVVAA